MAQGHRKVILEVDHTAVAKDLRSAMEDRSPISGLQHETLELIRSFCGFSISFAQREANSVAHPCARMVSLVKT